MSEMHMSDEDAQKEHESILAEIAKEKGHDSADTKPDPEEENKDEPVDTEEDDKPEDRSEGTKREPQSEDEEEDVDPDLDQKSRQVVPLSKYQETKKTLEGEKKSLQDQVVNLTEELNKTKTTAKIGDKVKAFSEAHNMPEEAVLDLVQLVRGESQLDPETKAVIEKSAIALKKQEAQEKWDAEMSAFIAENPDAKEFTEAIREKAFEKDNLNKSLFEVFHRFVKPDVVQKKKTGEVSRGTTRSTMQKFDPKAVIAKIESGAAKPFEGLTDAQVDEVFSSMNTGSRYNK